MAEPLDLKAADIRAALRRMYPSPECGIAFEVAQATGFNARRHLDCIAMELWPSRGLALNGIEIKVNIYDWRREKADPAKAEEIARFCDFFYVAAPAGLIPIEDIPTAWGLIEVDADIKGKIRKQALKNEHAQPVTKLFLAAVMRAASRPADGDTVEAMLAKRERELEAKFNERVKQQAEYISQNNDRASQLWKELVKAIDPDADLSNLYRDDGLIGAIRAVHKAGVTSSWNGLRSLFQSVEAIHEKLQGIAAELGIELVDINGKSLVKTTKKRKVANG